MFIVVWRLKAKADEKARASRPPATKTREVEEEENEFPLPFSHA